jgi:hypothetical protein
MKKHRGKLRAIPSSEVYWAGRPPGEIARLALEQHKELPLESQQASQRQSGILAEWSRPQDTREERRAWMIAHSLKGYKMLKKRVPYVAGTIEVASPDDPEVKFRLKKIGNRELIAYRDRDKVIRYTTRNSENGEEYVSEKEYPRGSNQLDTILLCLDSWDIAHPDNGLQLPITLDTLVDYLSTEELDFLFDQCFEVNPVLLGVGARKKSAENSASTTTGSTESGDDAS